MNDLSSLKPAVGEAAVQHMVQHIWNPATGILDLPADWQSLGASEIPGIRLVWEDQRERLKGTEQLSEFTERLSREWAIETGIIENLYEIERGITQTLIERGFQAELLSYGSTNRPREYVLQLLRDQKDALEGVFDFVSSRRELSVSYIKELHAALVRSQTHTDALDAEGRSVQMELIRGDWKKQPNFPVRGGVTYAYCPPEHVASEMDRLIEMHRTHIAQDIPPDVQAAWLHHRFTQIHPFQDGNGRVARALASLVLVKSGLFPLVVTRDDKSQYLDSLESADLGDLKALVRLIARLQRVQFTKASAVSEAILAADADVQQMLGNLNRAAEKAAEKKREELQKVFVRAQEIEDETYERLQVLAPGVVEALRKVSASADAFVVRASDSTDHYYRAQIIENAKKNLGYYADTGSYRSWVALCLTWERKARLVFAFHGIGRPFSGSLICAPFLEFRDVDEEDHPRSTVVPIAEEGFVFFYNEAPATVLERFKPWREYVLKVAIRELSLNL